MDVQTFEQEGYALLPVRHMFARRFAIPFTLVVGVLGGRFLLPHLEGITHHGIQLRGSPGQGCSIKHGESVLILGRITSNSEASKSVACKAYEEVAPNVWLHCSCEPP